MNKNIKKSIISLSLFINMLATIGCGKTIDCEIEGNHMHKYRNNTGIERYIEGEEENTSIFGKNAYYRTDEYIPLNEENASLYATISSNSLVSIQDNQDKLFEISESLKDYYEFRYYYYETEYHTHTYTDADGKVHSYTTSEEVKKYSWTTNPNHGNKTGEKRVITHVFYGYALVKNKDGNYTIIEGGPVDDIRILIEMGYKYVKADFIKTMERDDYLKIVGLYGHINDSDLKPVYVIVNDEYVLYDEYVLKR